MKLYIISVHKRSLGQGNIFRSVCQEFCSWGVLSQHALQVVSQHALQQVSGVVVSQHALQVSRPMPKGKFRGIWLGGLQAHTQGGSWGDLVQAHSQGGSWPGSGPGPHPRGKLRGIGGCLLWGVCLGGAWSRGCLLQGECLLWGGGWRLPVTATAAGGMHPTGMHSCIN